MSSLTPTHKYAAGALFGLALHQAQIHQTNPLGLFPDEDSSDERISSSSSDSVSDDPQLWVHDSSDLLRPIFRFLGIDENAWHGLEETAGASPSNHHVGAFLRLLAEESDDTSKDVRDQELALSKAVDAMASSMDTSVDFVAKKAKHREYVHECREKFSNAEMQSQSEEELNGLKDQQDKKDGSSREIPIGSGSKFDEKPFQEVSALAYPRKVTILYELLSACLAITPEHNKKTTKRRMGYDARHRMALRLLATWFNIKWIKMEALETIVAYSAMALLKEEQSKEQEKESPKSKWAKWKRGGIIGAAALTGGALMAITGGLAAPAIAAGFGALAPTLGTIIPVIGASGFAAAATAAGSVAGSVAVAASFGGKFGLPNRDWKQTP